MEYLNGAQGADGQCASSSIDISETTVKQSALQIFVSRFRDFCRKREGTQLVEFAMIAPVLIALVIGIVVVGIAINNYIILTDAVGQGARAFALARNEDSITSGDPCAYAITVANNDATSLNKTKITYSIAYTNSGSGLSTLTTTTYTSSCSGLGGSNMNPQDSVVMTATYPAVIPLFSQSGLFSWVHMGALNLVAHAGQLVQ